MKRRAFLQRAGLALAAIGVSQAGLLRLSDRYYQVLAQTSSRKLALLVGINQYPQWPALTGCITDVELQQELLIYRFGFQPEDVLILTDQQATRENIETAFVEHLIGQAKPGDVVVFHFSGYGNFLQEQETSQAGEEESSPIIQNSKFSTTAARSAIQNSLIPVDASVSSKGVSGVNLLLEETLWLLLRSLKTDRVTTVLDTSFTDPSISGFTPPLLGNLRVRSRPPLPAEQLTAEEFAFQKQLQQNFLTTGLPRPQKTPRPGIILAASGPNQIAAEVQWNGFSAGLFTYTLTQHLWQATPTSTIQVSLNRVAGVVEQTAGNQQQPLLSYPTNQQQQSLNYYLPPAVGATADGVVMAVEDIGKSGYLWLAGLPANVLEFYGVNSLLTLVPPPGSDSGLILPPLQIRSREGLKARAKLKLADSALTQDSGLKTQNLLQVGQLVQEAIRVLPRNIGLTVALDSSLERIERVDATSAFSNIPHVSPVIAGEQPADCLFGRVQKRTPITKEDPSAVPTNYPSPIVSPQYGLFSLGRELISNTVGEPGEAVKTSVYRLIPKLHAQLAAKLLRLSANEGSSRLGVKATLEMVAPNERVVMQRSTLRAPWPDSTSGIQSPSAKDAKIVTLPVGSQVQYRLYNYSDRPIYFMLLGTDSSGSAIALYSHTTDASETRPTLKDEVILPGETIIFPQTSNPYKWIVQGPAGFAEMQLIFSRAPFTQTLTTLDMAQHPRSDAQRVGPLLNPLEVARAVLQDLHQASATSSAEMMGTASDTFALDVNAWATLSFVYQVV